MSYNKLSASMRVLDKLDLATLPEQDDTRLQRFSRRLLATVILADPVFAKNKTWEPDIIGSSYNRLSDLKWVGACALGFVVTSTCIMAFAPKFVEVLQNHYVRPPGVINHSNSPSPSPLPTLSETPWPKISS